LRKISSTASSHEALARIGACSGETTISKINWDGGPGALADLLFTAESPAIAGSASLPVFAVLYDGSRIK
jgi:hypothetical protein